MAWRNSRCITKPTWTAAAAAFWIFARCFGRMDGRWAATISGAGLLKYSPNGAASRSNWRWISCAWPDAAAALEASGVVDADAVALLLARPAPLELPAPPLLPQALPQRRLHR